MPEYGSLFVCLMGMGTVFFGLICLIVLTTIMGKIVGGHAAPAVSAPAPAAEVEREEAQAPAPEAEPVQEEDRKAR